jgi:hypothetical protein
MRKMQFLRLVLCLLVVFAVASCGGNYDHYKAYTASADHEEQHNVNLEDQFETTAGVVNAIKFFANPVSKDGEDIYDDRTHLTWYELEDDGSQIKRSVTFSNQFGTQKWTIGKPVFLLVPTEKIEKGGAEPDKTMHFKCYEVLQGEFLERKVTLEDQFGKETEVVVKPMYFCTPVKKNDEEAGKKHLVCYLIESKESERLVKIRNQFGEYDLKLEKGLMLCVPSDKKEVEELGN